MQAQNQPQETWIKVLSKGVITIPKEFREQLGLEEGVVVKARIEGIASSFNRERLPNTQNTGRFPKSRLMSL